MKSKEKNVCAMTCVYVCEWMVTSIQFRFGEPLACMCSFFCKFSVRNDAFKSFILFSCYKASTFFLHFSFFLHMISQQREKRNKHGYSWSIEVDRFFSEYNHKLHKVYST